MKILSDFKFTPNWGLEAQYLDLGKRELVLTNSGAQIKTGSLKVSRLSIAATGTLPLASNFSLFGKFGFGKQRKSQSDCASCWFCCNKL